MEIGLPVLVNRKLAEQNGTWEDMNLQWNKKIMNVYFFFQFDHLFTSNVLTFLSPFYAPDTYIL